jgi:hypothetical protein
MKFIKHRLTFATLALFALTTGMDIRTIFAADSPPVITPPESFFEIVNQRDRDVGRQFYKKYIDVKGMPVVASGEVADLALQRTYDIVTHLLAGRPDVIEAMVKNKMYLIIIGKDQVYTDMPEYRNSPNPAYQNERVRGTADGPRVSARRICSVCPSIVTTTRASACMSSVTRSTARCARLIRRGANERTKFFATR